MTRSRWVVTALSAVSLAIVASVLLLRPAGGVDGAGQSHLEPAIMIDPAGFPYDRDAILGAGEGAQGGRAVRRETARPEPGTERPASRPLVRDRGGLGEYLDPDAHPVSPFAGGVSDDAGEFQDPEHDLPIPPPRGGVSDVGDYLAPEEGP